MSDDSEQNSTYMQALPPPLNVILYKPSQKGFDPRYDTVDLHLRVNAREVCFRDTFREGVQPAVRLPLIGVFSPDSLGPVRSEDRDDDVCVLLERDLRDLRLAVRGLDRPEEGEHDVLPCPSSTSYLLV